MKQPTPLEAWAFAWQKNTGTCLTRIVRITRRDLIIYVEQNFGQTWADVRRQGGRAIKVTISSR